MSKPKFRTRFTAHDRVQLICPPEEGRTKQEFKDDCNLNKIMARYQKTGILPQSALASKAMYGDFSQVPSFMEMQQRVIAAHELFDALPAQVRKQFDNDPGKFIEAADTEEGRKLMIKLGLGAEQKGEGVPPETPKPKVEPEAKPAPTKADK